jgi:hypothetical protein
VIRRLVLAATLAATLGGVGAATASALPGSTTEARWACVSVVPADKGYCVSSPLGVVDVPDAPKPPKLPAPPLP